MQLLIHADPARKQALIAKGIPETVQVQWFEAGSTLPEADVFFDLQFEDAGRSVFGSLSTKPVLVSAVIASRDALQDNMIRINAWNGFLERPLVEIGAIPSMIDTAKTLMEQLGWQYQLAPDTPGMISARVIAMIINEAYFGLGDGISSKEEIDTAMKLGTNYPYGPFEWSEKIGLHKIHALLEALSKKNARYSIAPLLQEAAAAKKS